MSFRDRMKKKGSSLEKRHNDPQKKTTGSRFPTIFIKENIPEGVEFFKCTEGEHIVDIIPWYVGADMPIDERNQPVTKEGDMDYVLNLFVHQNVGKMGTPYVCPYQNFGDPCPICEYIKENRLPKDEWSKLRAKQRVIYLVWSHDDRESEKKGIQIFEAAYFFMEEKIDEIAKLPRGGGYETFSHPDNGKSLAWTRKGSGKENTQYLGHKFIERESPIPEKILDQTFALDQVVNMRPAYEEIQKAFKSTLVGADTEEDEPPFDPDEEDGPSVFDEEDEAPRVKRKRPTDRPRTEGSGTVKRKIKRKRRE